VTTRLSSAPMNSASEVMTNAQIVRVRPLISRILLLGCD
jgi:hypothetical protein